MNKEQLMKLQSEIGEVFRYIIKDNNIKQFKFNTNNKDTCRLKKTEYNEAGEERYNRLKIHKIVRTVERHISVAFYELTFQIFDKNYVELSKYKVYVTCDISIMDCGCFHHLNNSDVSKVISQDGIILFDNKIVKDIETLISIICGTLNQQKEQDDYEAAYKIINKFNTNPDKVQC